MNATEKKPRQRKQDNEKPISKRQQMILDVVQKSVETKGYPPSVREIAAQVGLASPSTVKHHLDALEERGLIRRQARHPRALDIRSSDSRKKSSRQAPTSAVVEIPATVAEGSETVAPLVGRIAAGAPITAEQMVEDYFHLPTRVTGGGQLFVLEVHGDSMQDAAILDGDFVVVRAQNIAEDGEIVAAMVDDEATVKVLSHRDGHRWLLPKNEDYSPINGDNAVILGKIVTVVRQV